jgi:hypothetical protein
VQLPVTLVLRQSRVLAVALTVAHGVAAMGVAPTSLPIPGKLLVGLFIAISLFRCLRRRPAAALTLRSDGSLEIERPDGRREEARVLPRTTVYPWLVVLSALVGGRKESFVLPVDATGIDGHRRLRLWLRWKASAATA